MRTTAKRSFVVLLLVFAVVGGLALLGVRFAVNGEKSFIISRRNARGSG